MNKTKNKKKHKKVSAKLKASNSKPKAAKIANKKPEEIMDRLTLIGIARLLKRAGSDVKALKDDTDSELQRKVNEAIHGLPTPEIIKQLEAIDPNKLTNTLKQDCLGIFVDFADVSCVHCPDAKACVSAFVNNLQGGFTRFQTVMTDGEGDKPKLANKAESKPPAASRYEPERLVFVRDVQNPNSKGDDYYRTIQRVLDDQPENLAELRAIVEQDFDLSGDGDFMKFVTALRDPKEGVIKLDVDLNDNDKSALREVGYAV